MIRVMKATALQDHKLEVSFSDGTSGVVDLSCLIRSELFSRLSDEESFAQFSISRDGRVIAWDEELELCADSLYLKTTGKRPQEILPGLKTRV